MNDSAEEEDDEIPNIQAVIQHSEDPPSFIRTLDLEAMHALEFPEYANMASDYTVGGELFVRMQFSDREAVVRAIKNYSISKSVDYNVCESESRTFLL